MTSLRTNWITVLAGLSTAILIIAGVNGITTGGYSGDAEGRVYGVVGLLAGLALVAGLWLLRSDRATTSISYSLLVVGIIVQGATYWWIGITPLIALTLLYFGVFRHGLARELQNTGSS